MRLREPPHLAHLDPDCAAWTVLIHVHRRALRDAGRLGLALKVSAAMLPTGQDEAALTNRALGQSKVYRTAQLCAEWAIRGRGEPEAITPALKEMCADLDGTDVGDGPSRLPDLTTTPGVLVAAATARLALAEGRTVDVMDVATLASVDERTVRAAVQAGALRPVTKRRPMRFAAELVRVYLYARGVQGFSAPQEPEVPRALTG
jgi:hypothetical protein